MVSFSSLDLRVVTFDMERVLNSVSRLKGPSTNITNTSGRAHILVAITWLKTKVPKSLNGKLQLVRYKRAAARVETTHAWKRVAQVTRQLLARVSPFQEEAVFARKILPLSAPTVGWVRRRLTVRTKKWNTKDWSWRCVHTQSLKIIIFCHATSQLTFALEPAVGDGFVWPSGTENKTTGLSRPVYRLQTTRRQTDQFSIHVYFGIAFVLSIISWGLLTRYDKHVREIQTMNREDPGKEFGI